MKRIFTFLVLIFTMCMYVNAQPEKAPLVKEGKGPFERLIIRGVTLIRGDGIPPYGPVDIVIEKNIIKDVVTVGAPGHINEKRRPVADENTQEINAEGMFALPGFIDMHGHIGGTSDDQTAEYVFKLWLGHGITTVREPGSFNGLDWTLWHKQKSLENAITAPRIFAYCGFGMGRKAPITTAEEARAWVQDVKKKGADGIKFFGAKPEVMEAALDEAGKQGLGSACHHAQLNVVRWNALTSAKAGLTSMEHWYGLPEALFENQIVQDYPADYNYQDEQDRFEEAGKLWKQAAKPGSEKWEEVMNEFLKLDFTLDPTFNIYDANRDLMRARRDEWHEIYTLPGLWQFWQPSLTSHGSYWHFWGTEQEVTWKQNYRIWMQFVNEYKNKGGRVTTGSDSGYIYKLFGFGYIRELELLREAGFHPLEVIRSATIMGAEALGIDDKIGTVEPGKYADIILIDENPLENLQVLYGTGAIKLMPDGEIKRVGGVRYTIKDGIIYDAKALLKDVATMVEQEKAKTGFEIVQPGF